MQIFCANAQVALPFVSIAKNELIAVNWNSHSKEIAKHNMGMGQNLVPLVNIKIAGKWMFIPLKMYL